MTVKGFLAKATKPNISAQGFLDQYREFMLTGELSYVLSPILAKVDAGEMMPTPAVAAIAVATMYHRIAKDTIAAKKSIAAQEDAKEEGPAKVKAPRKVSNWTSTVLDSAGNVCTRINAKGEEEDMVKGFDASGDADRWSDRRLALDCVAGCYAVVSHAHSAVKTFIMRDDAMARFYRQAKGPTIKPQSKTTDKLGFGVKAKESRSSFSRG